MSAVISVVPATVGHVCELAVTMREADRREVERLGYSTYDAAFRSLVLSGGEAWTLLINNRVAAIGGVMSYGLLQGIGIAWVLTSHEVDRYPVAFWKASRKVLASLTTRYWYLTNLVDSRYIVSLRWLERLGFEIKGEMVVNGSPFSCVLKRSPVWA